MKTRHQINFRSTENELRLIADAAKVAGVSKTEFIFSAAIEAAKRFGLDPEAYFVSETIVTPQNTRIGFFSSEGDQKVGHGVDKDASPASAGIAIGKGRLTPTKAKR